MKIGDEELFSLLLKENYISEEDAKEWKVKPAGSRGPLFEYLTARKILTPDLFGQAISEFLRVPYADLNSNPPSREAVLTIPEDLAKKYRAVLYSKKGKVATVASDDPTAGDLITALSPMFVGMKIVPAYGLPEDIDAAFIHYAKSLETRFAEIIKKEARVAPEILDQIFIDAIAHTASDIHIEPQDKEVLVRFRIDGVLHEAGRIRKEFYGNILNRVKVEARLRIDEHNAVQDGAIRYINKNSAVDMRVSVAPTLDGEKIVIRILSQYVRGYLLEDLGLSLAGREVTARASRKPFGMIIVSGPTGSGKTTTLYALLKTLHRPEINITTIEDPVEYRISGINQIQVNEDAGITFASGLRSIVRQDPNIILVGEIRDKETADIAVNAALTGHLMLSTFHANDAATAIPRLLTMGIEPFLLSSTLELLVGQRLVRKICDSCRTSINLDRSSIAKIDEHLTDWVMPGVFYKGKGCLACGGSGFRGRTGVFETISMTPELQDLIMKNPSAGEIWNLAKSQGALPMFEDGLKKVREGVTTLEELLRVVLPPKEH